MDIDAALIQYPKCFQSPCAAYTAAAPTSSAISTEGKIRVLTKPSFPAS